MAALNTLLFLLAALAIPGLINRTRALLAGRKGIRFAQHLYDVRLLLRKGAVYSPTTTAVFRAAPSVTLGTALVAALFVPVGDLPSALSFEGDLIAFAYLLALGRVALILAAMDTGSSFEGMGASREALYGALVEPALMLVFGLRRGRPCASAGAERRGLHQRQGSHPGEHPAVRPHGAGGYPPPGFLAGQQGFPVPHRRGKRQAVPDGVREAGRR